MGVTLSHQSALDVLRTIRSIGVNIRDAEPVRLSEPSAWVGKRWRPSVFADPKWKWSVPSKDNPLHVLVPSRNRRIQMSQVISHAQPPCMPAGSILWLDDCSNVVCPELLFLQMANSFSFPALVLLGYELCGHFSRDAFDPSSGAVKMELSQATSIESLSSYLEEFRHVPGIAKARTALQYVTDHAASAPEAILATVYSLPSEECGYGMGPITLNSYVNTDEPADAASKKSRYPDIMFPFAPVGINYDGKDHLDLDKIVDAMLRNTRLEGNNQNPPDSSLEEAMRQVREKYVDDMRRNRQLVAHGKIVLPLTKEDLDGWGNLDRFTRQILTCAHNFFDVDTTEFKMTLDDTEKARDRYALLSSMLPGGRRRGSTHG